MMHFRSQLVGACWLAVISMQFFAANPVMAQVRDMTPDEVAALPEYCPYMTTFGGPNVTRAGVAYWKDRFGELAYSGMHHYCWALLHMNRATRSKLSAVERRGHYKNAIADIDYVLRRTNEDFPLLPEIFTRRGEALSYLKQYADAETDFRRAISLREDYWPAYAKLATSFLNQGKYDAARETLKAGIPKASDSRMLKRMLDQIEQGKR